MEAGHLSSEFEKLQESRRTLQREVRLAIACVTTEEKRGIVERWNRELSPLMAAQLLRVVKDKAARIKIATWKW